MLFGCEGIDLSLGGRDILKQVSVSARSGEILGLVGPNGAGKTSLFEVLCGRYTANAGKVMLDGQDITALPFHKRTRLGLGRTYQSPVVPASLTIAETFRATRKAYRPYLSRHEAEWAARLVHLHSPWDTPAAALGAFERRKLLLACLMLRAPRMILMDEPASALDPIATAKIEELIDELSGRYAIVIVTHSMQQAARVSQRTAFFHLGKMVEYGPTSDIFTNPIEERTKDYITGRYG